MREDKKIKKEQHPSSYYSNIFLLPIIFGIIVIMAMKYNPFKIEQNDVGKLQKKHLECQTKLLSRETQLYKIDNEKSSCVNDKSHIKELYESLHAKLESALKEKLAALEDRLSILVQLRDSEERAADSEAFINILKRECDSKQDLLDATIEENTSLEKLIREQSKQLNEQSEEILILKKLFINS